MENHLYMPITQWLLHRNVVNEIKKTEHFVSNNVGKEKVMPKKFNAITVYIYNTQQIKAEAKKQMIMKSKMLYRKKNLKNQMKEYKPDNFNFGERKTKFQPFFQKRAISILGEE